MNDLAIKGAVHSYWGGSLTSSPDTHKASSTMELICLQQSEIIYKEAFTYIWVGKIRMLLQYVLYLYFLFKM